MSPDPLIFAIQYLGMIALAIPVVTAVIYLMVGK